MTKKTDSLKRTSIGLIDLLFDEMGNLINGTSTPQSANAKVALAKAIISTKRLEIEAARFVSDEKRDGNGEVKEVNLGS